MVEKAEGKVEAFLFVISLFDLGGKKLLEGKGYKTFNFSLVGLHLEEYFALFNLISQTQKAKIIYIHQDFWVFNKNQRKIDKTKGYFKDGVW